VETHELFFEKLSKVFEILEKLWLCLW